MDDEEWGVCDEHARQVWHMGLECPACLEVAELERVIVELETEVYGGPATSAVEESPV